jgi:NodT family efflux transporter outer membrane factor (OMF) lipoprotein
MKPRHGRASRWLSAGMSLAALAGCVVGPDYQLPKDADYNAPGARQAFAGTRNNPVVSSEAPPPGQWWHLYQSPQLDRLIEQALAANTDLRVANANLARSQAMVRVARAQGQPQAGFQAGVERGLISAEQYLSDADLPVMNLYTIDLSASYEFDLFGRIQRGIEAADADDEAVEAARDWVRVTVAANVTRSFIDLCASGHELGVATRLVELQQHNLDLTQRLKDGGRATRLDTTRSRTLVHQLQATVPAIESKRRDALYQLAVLTGKPPGDYDADLERCEAAPPLPAPIPVGDGAALLRRRPDVRAAERRLAAASAEIGVATAELYPRVSLHVGLGSVGETKDFLLRRTNTWGVGPVVSWQVNQSAARARIAAGNAGEQAALARFDAAVLEALREMESALNAYRHDLERQAALQAALDDASKAAADAHTLEEAGRSASLSTLDAERTSANAALSLAGVEAQVAADQVSLFRAIGGGWEPAASDAGGTTGGAATGR